MKRAKADRQQAERTGRIAELVALSWPLCTGHRLLARRYSTAGGEIDLIERRDRVINFCEVKCRWPTGHDGMPSPLQQPRIYNAARELIALNHNPLGLKCRFDLIRISRFT